MGVSGVTPVNPEELNSPACLSSQVSRGCQIRSPNISDIPHRTKISPPTRGPSGRFTNVANPQPICPPHMFPLVRLFPSKMLKIASVKKTASSDAITCPQ